MPSVGMPLAGCRSATARLACLGILNDRDAQTSLCKPTNDDEGGYR